MTLNPEEFVTLTGHGSMKLRAAVSRAMTLLSKERERTTIVRLRRSGTNGSCQSTSFAVLVSIGPPVTTH